MSCDDAHPAPSDLIDSVDIIDEHNVDKSSLPSQDSMPSLVSSDDEDADLSLEESMPGSI